MMYARDPDKAILNVLRIFEFLKGSMIQYEIHFLPLFRPDSFLESNVLQV